MGLWDRFAAAYKALVSPGERKIMGLFPGQSGAPAGWLANRGELVGHYTGWDYVAIKAICDAVAGNPPQVAYRRSRASVGAEREKCVKAMGPTLAREHLKAKYLPKHLRTKAMANVQAHEELEPVGPDHPLLRLINNPNGPDVAFSFLFRMSLYAELCGASYIWAVTNRLGEPAELWVIPAHWMRRKPGKDRITDAWEVRPWLGYAPGDMGFGWFPGGGDLLTLDPDDVIEFLNPHPLSPFDGYSPLTAMGAWVDAGDGNDQGRVAYLRNAMFFGVVVLIDKELANPSAETIARVQETLSQKYAGVRNTGKAAVLAPGVTLAPYPHAEAADFGHVETGDQLQRWRLAGHRVGPSIAGLAEQTTYASMVAAEAGFQRNTMKPKLAYYGQVLTEKLARRFDEDLVIYWPDPTVSDPEMKQRQWEAGLQNQCVAPNEYRQDVLMLEPFGAGGDDPMAPMGISPIALHTGQDADLLPVPAVTADRLAQGQDAGEDRWRMGDSGQGGKGDGEGGNEDKPDRFGGLLDGKHLANGKGGHAA